MPRSQRLTCVQIGGARPKHSVSIYHPSMSSDILLRRFMPASQGHHRGFTRSCSGSARTMTAPSFLTSATGTLHPHCRLQPPAILCPGCISPPICGLRNVHRAAAGFVACNQNPPFAHLMQKFLSSVCLLQSQAVHAQGDCSRPHDAGEQDVQGEFCIRRNGISMSTFRLLAHSWRGVVGTTSYTECELAWHLRQADAWPQKAGAAARLSLTPRGMLCRRWSSCSGGCQMLASSM